MNTAGGEWLTVGEVAARLGVSERAIQKRCRAGTIKARRVTTPQGKRWEVDARQLSTEQTNRTDEPNERTPAAPVSSVKRTDEPNARPEPAEPTNRTNERELMAALMAEKDARIGDLKEQLRAANNALEREQHAHAETRRLFAFNLSALPSPPTVAPDLATTSAPTNRPPQRPKRRRPRPFWAALIGYRPKD